MYNLYIGDIDEQEILGWLCENIGPIARTVKEEYNYFNTYHGSNNLWVMNTSDVSDVSGQYDTITLVSFKRPEDAMLTKIRWGGSGT